MLVDRLGDFTMKRDQNYFEQYIDVYFRTTAALEQKIESLVSLLSSSQGASIRSSSHLTPPESQGFSEPSPPDKRQHEREEGLPEDFPSPDR